MTPAELFQALGQDFVVSGGHHHARPGWIQLRHCPFCGTDNYRLGFNLSGLYFSCWKCGSLRVKDTLLAMGATQVELRHFFRDVDRIRIPRAKPQGRLQEPPKRVRMENAHRTYLVSRGFDAEELERIWELEGIGFNGGELQWRIYIPVIQNRMRVSWTTRAIGDVELRYRAALPSQEATPIKHCIYGLDLACHSIVLVEGPADAWRIGPGAGALFGTAFTTAQVKLAARFPFRYILFDNEDDAQKQARKLAQALSCFPGKTEILRCDAKDPGQMSDKELRQLRRIVKLEY